ncbi:MAG: SlyX family protein [Gammaproteobacteria bacterium]|nr:SlyX family protein [Gammaproteobacteria bacterium]
MNQTGTEQHLDELESRLAFQDDLIEKLNDIVARQDREILALVRKVEELDSKLGELAAESAAPPGAPETEIPPHY